MIFTCTMETVHLMLIPTFLSKLAAPWLMISIKTEVSNKKSSCLKLFADVRGTCCTPSIATTYLWQQPYISSFTCDSECDSSFRITPVTTFRLLSSRHTLKAKQHQNNLINIQFILNYNKTSLI